MDVSANVRERANVRRGWEGVYFSFGGVSIICICNLIEFLVFITGIYLWSINTE